MNPLTPKMLEDWVALVVGTLYKAWTQAGVTTDAHDEGTASDERLTAGLLGSLRGVEKTGNRPKGLGKLIG